MKRGSLLCAGLWPFIFLPLLLLLPLLFFKWHAIEEDVANNAKADLASNETNWVKIETTNRGRDILITGTPPDQATLDRVVEKVQKSYGVNLVEVSSDAKPPPTPAELNTILTGQSVVLRGTLANQKSINAVITQASQAFGEGNIINKLSVGNNIADLPNLNVFFQSLAGKGFALETLTASLKGGTLSLTGMVNSTESNNELLDQMTSSLGLTVENTLTIAAPPIEGDVCQDLVNDLLSNGKINFASAKAIIKDDSLSLLENIQTTALRCPDASFEVSGHSDSLGNLDFNMKLSQQRAQAVVDHLVSAGLDASKFSAVGYGPTKPIAENTTADGRARNRRIEFKLKN